MNTDVRSIVDMAQGAIKERVDYEMSHILDNIRDPNTRADRKRTLTLNLVFSPDADRKQIAVSVTAKSKLEPTNPVATALYITGDSVVEMVPQIPGQQNVYGGEQEKPAALRLIKGA